MPTLRARRDFDRIQASGRTRADRLMVIRWVPNELKHHRFGISTGKRLGGAVQRNVVRRRLREILRQTPMASDVAYDILIVARPASADATFADLSAALGRLLHWVAGVSVTTTA